MALRLSAPAKINLSLEVLGRRADGYHELSSLFLPVGLFDELVIDRSDDGISLSVTGAGLPADESNLAWRAAAVFFEAAGLEPGLEIELTKNIPLAAGLGGGSSDAAAVLKGANRLYGSPFDDSELKRLALKLGADVPFFIDARPAWAGGVGERLTPIELPKYHFILVNPGFEVSTAWAYSRLQKPLTRPGATDTIVTPAIGSYQDLAPLANDLEPVVVERWPVVGRIRERLMEAGAKLSRMSGSGPTVFGLFETEAEAVSAEGRLKREGSWRVFLAQGLS